ncbi:formylglycine-generating enzyme family protein [Leptospira idonii]|uniref:Sulfatase n=1 Tax=Leptospira idonii TaxID=1193500 RepID=A0A4R9M3S4_9LEPT|nr:SUMF1/EgtB/PvdO family nonheme iron enzyme [Leptospira idonii]TGN20377.1 sulfatase [Leptospira idonii]
MKRIAFFLLFVFFLSSVSFAQENETEEDVSPFATTKKKVLLWKGDVVGVYKNRVWIKIRIYRNQKIAKYSSEELKSLFDSKKDYPVYQKETNLPVGSFLLREAVWEEKKIQPKDKYFEVILVGDFSSDPKSKLSGVTTDTYIASYVEEDFYVEPGGYFKGRFTPPRKSIVHPKDRKEMVLITRSLFLYGQGTDPSQDNFNPYFNDPSLATLKELPSYYIDKYEVTNGEYSYYLKQTNSTPPSHWIGGKFPSGEENHPVVNLTYREVEKYSRWVGKRIPTEWEWEKAARGPGVVEYTNRDETLSYQIITTKYPFGDDYDSLLCNSRESKLGKTVSVFELSTEGSSPYGAMGMCGNAPEWTSSWYELYPGHHLKNFSFGKIYKVVRGGSFSENAKNSSAVSRSYGGIPNLTEDRRAGFRLVMDYRD